MYSSVYEMEPGVPISGDEMQKIADNLAVILDRHTV
jgi:hypothetical protein